MLFKDVPLKPEGRYCCIKSKPIAPFWFSLEHCWTALTAFWFSVDDLCSIPNQLTTKGRAFLHIVSFFRYNPSRWSGWTIRSFLTLSASHVSALSMSTGRWSWTMPGLTPMWSNWRWVTLWAVYSSFFPQQPLKQWQNTLTLFKAFYKLVIMLLISVLSYTLSYW